jgi:hypothetical protein
MRRDVLPGVVGLLVIGELIILDVSQRISPGPSLTAQEQSKGAQERLTAAGHDPGSVDGV